MQPDEELPPATSKHGTLVPNVVSRVEIVGAYGGIDVVNRDLIGEIWVRIDGIDPVIAGESSFAVMGARRFLTWRRGQMLDVRLISVDPRNFSVEAV